MNPNENMNHDDDLPRPPSPSDDPLVEPHLLPTSLEDFKITNQFIQLLRTASLDEKHADLDTETLQRLRNPPRELPILTADERLSIDLFLSVSNTSVETYNSVCDEIPVFLTTVSRS
jgi:hypothetical protein